MNTLNTIELQAFIPAKDFERSKQFYRDIGFTLGWDANGVACLHHGKASFFLQDFYVKELAENLMLHLRVESVDAWWENIVEGKIAEKYGVRTLPPEQRAWGMRDFVLIDPSGVLWRIGENTP